jgi:N-acetylmuramoyl-L-alanine amidase
MKIALTVGHSILKNGNTTSADGKKYGGCNEYKWCKAFSKQVASALKKNGHTVKKIICPEKKFTSSKQEKPYKLNQINSGNFDLVIELHLNSSAPSAKGTEVLYTSSAGKKYAKKVQKQLSAVFLDRGIKRRDDLYILNGTKPPAILLETFFCTNKNDYKKAKGILNRQKLAKRIAKGIG